MRRKDLRPICKCTAYRFPHKIGGKCRGRTFTQFYYWNIKELCDGCNCDRDGVSCDVSEGLESVKYAGCYVEFCHTQPSETLPIKLEDIM